MFGLNLKIAAGLVAGAVAASGMSYVKGRWDGWAAKEAQIARRDAQAMDDAKAERERVLAGDRSRVEGFDRD